MSTKVFSPNQALLRTAIFIVCCFWALSSYAAIRYVRPTASGTGDGSSWANASDNLQAMINASAPGDEVWVATGTYKPSAYPVGCIGCNSPRDFTFHLINGVALYGGFAGTETALEERNIPANPTILSGDFDGDDVVTGSGSTLSIANNGENAYHVVLSVSDAATTVLDGFTVRGGNANGGSDNISVEGQGIFRNNGGGMYNRSSSPSITNTTFSGNSATNNGGGMYNRSSSPSITNTTFSGNSATNNGGGMYNLNSSPSITNTTFSGNSATNNGGGMYNQNASPSITNTAFSGNSANDNGGGMFNDSSSPSITHTTFSGNSATISGGGILNFASNPNIRNSILWGNGTEIFNSGSTPVVTHSIVQGGYAGTGNLNIDPLFVNAANPAGPDGIPRTADDGLRLQVGSPAINAGDNSLIPMGITTDITGADRIQDGTVDMGAYEGGVFPCPSATTLYVDQSVSSSGNGTSWATAFKTLDEALLIAHNCPDVATINVAAGTYKPTSKPYANGVPITTTDDRDVTFHLANGVALYGGFPNGGGTRDWAANPTILSGDFNGDDVVTGSGSTLSIANNGENAYHVVLSVNDGATTVLDGFTVRGGNANDGGNITVEGQDIFRNSGGGMYNRSSSPSITHTTFSGNSANRGGGGMFNDSSSPSITHTTFSGNSANFGGGMLNAGSANPSITNTTFSGNSANFGGGMLNISSSPSITNTTFSGNSATNNGGGMYNDSSSPSITNTTFSGNSANFGGGMLNDFSSPSITNTTFSGNRANTYGGGMYNQNASPSITNTTFSGNSANFGGGMLNISSSPSITNTTFSGNSATISGGGILNFASNPNIRNNILWGNGTEIANFSSTPVVSHSIVQGGYAGTGNLSADPLFVNAANPAGPDGIPRTADDGLRLQVGSPAINAGDNSLIPMGITTDIIGADRIQDGTVDMGAYEGGVFPCPSATTLYVDQSVSSSGNGTSWATAFKTLDEALLIAHNCPDVATINVAAGTYKPTSKPYANGVPITTTDDRDVTFHLANGVALYGGFPNGGGTRDWAANPTILSGDFNGDDVVTGSGSTLSITNNGENAYHVVLSVNDGAATVLDGFTVRGGNANGSGSITVEGEGIFRTVGGGMYNFSSSPSITHTTFSGNSASFFGGGIYNVNLSSPSITHTTFSGNSAASGGGMYNAGSSPSITHTTFSGNSATNLGGGMSNSSSSPSITNTTFSGNSANFFGGGMLNISSSPSITNTTFSGNSANFFGGGMFNNNSSPSITNTTFSGNSANNQGGGMYNEVFSSPSIRNSILWGNGTEIINGFEGNATVSHSIIQGGYAGTGNLSADPLFVNAANPAGPDGIPRTADDGLRLQVGSPAINAGDNSLIPMGISTDIIGADRIQDGTVDLGAYEGGVLVCPDLSAAAPAAVVSSQSTCTNCTLSGGVIAAPTSACPTGATLQYSTDNGDTWTTTLPAYNQSAPVTVLTRCLCDTDDTVASPTSSVTTVPGACLPLAITRCPESRTFIGCNTDSISGPGFSSSVALSDYATFSSAANQGEATDICHITELSYQDMATGECPITVTRTWILKDENGPLPPCEQMLQINSPAVNLECPNNLTVSLCADQADIAMAFDDWIAEFDFSGGCNGAGMFDDIPAAPDSCAGGTVTLTYRVSSDCEPERMCSRTFSVSKCLRLSGHIQFWNDPGAGVKDATVSASGAASGSAQTLASGAYSIGAAFNAPGLVTLTPAKTLNPLNGVDVADVLAIQKHAANTEPITNAYRQIAADVNHNNLISSQDASILNQAIKGNTAALTILSNPSWRFVAASWTPVLPPWGFPQSIALEVSGAACEIADLDFVGVKKGDVVEGYANPANKAGSPTRTVRLIADDRLLRRGEQITLEVGASDFRELSAMQFGMRFEPAVLRLREAKGLQFLPSESFGLYRAEAGELRQAWTDLTPRSASVRGPLFSLRFEVLEGGMLLSEVLGLDAGVLPAAVFSLDLAGYPLEWVWRPAGLVVREQGSAPHTHAHAFGLMARPNPFSHTLIAAFELPESCEAQVRLLDMSGRVLAEQKSDFAEGYQEVSLRGHADAPAGIYFCELLTPWGVATQKVVKVAD